MYKTYRPKTIEDYTTANIKDLSSSLFILDMTTKNGNLLRQCLSVGYTISSYRIAMDKQRKEFGSITPFSANHGAWTVEDGSFRMGRRTLKYRNQVIESMKVFNYGSLNYDYVYSVAHMVAPGETLASSHMETNCGGKGLNQSIAMSKAGLHVYHAGMVGEDGEELVNMCKDNGIDTTFISSHAGKNGHAMIQVNRQGENSIILFEGSNGKNSTEKIKMVMEAVEEGDILLLQNEINLLDEIIEAAYEKKARIILNPSPFNEKVLQCKLEHVSVFILNEIEGGQMSGEAEPEDIISVLQKRYPEAEIVLTLGKDGVVYAGRGELCHMKSFRAAAVDTTAAGDTFTGYYIASEVDGVNKETALRRACAAAAIAVTRKGASVSIPVPDEVEKFLKEQGESNC